MAVSMAVSPNFSNFKLLICPVVAYRVRMLLESFHYPQAEPSARTNRRDGRPRKKKHAGVLGFLFCWMITTLEASVARDPGLESDKKKSKKRNKSDEGDRERSATSQQPSD